MGKAGADPVSGVLSRVLWRDSYFGRRLASMRSKYTVQVTFATGVVAAFATWALSQEPSQTPPRPGGAESGVPRRVAVNLSDKAIPLVLKSVRNLDSDSWIEDMELEVENTSNRPIYHLLITISFPEAPRTTRSDGKLSGLGTIVEYGRKDFGTHQDELARDDDVPIRPGEKAVLKLEQVYREGLRQYLVDHEFPESGIRQVQVRIDQISFGDGSGFVAGSIPFSRKGSAQ